MWACGDQIVLSHRVDGRVCWVAPVTMVEDSAECVALFLVAGTPIKHAVQRDGSPIPRSLPYEQRYRLPWRIGEGVWHTESCLILARPGAAHAVSLFWDGVDWSFNGWYVDLQAPLLRTSQGFETEDHVLDIVVDSAGVWRWKDENEFAVAQAVGRFSSRQATAIRAEAMKVVEQIEAWAWPFDAGLERWRPDPKWPIPSLPPESMLDDAAPGA